MPDDTPELEPKVLRQHRMGVPAPGEHLPGAKPGEPEHTLVKSTRIVIGGPVSDLLDKKAKLKPPHPNAIARFEDDGGPPNPKEET